MSNKEIKTWIKTRDTQYLKTYTGFKTNEGVKNFQSDFISFLDVHTDFGGIPASMQAYKDSLDDVA